MVREDYYFDKPGAQNTADVVKAVSKRVELANIGNVVVASTSGLTALKFARALKGKADVFCVPQPPYMSEAGYGKWPCLLPKYRKELEKIGAKIIDRVPYVFHSSVLEDAKPSTIVPEMIVKWTLYTLGQGLKVAVEVVLMAVAGGFIEPFKDVIGVGGSSEGADTAAIIRATYPPTIFSEDQKKKLEIREIIAMPRVKKWW